MKDFRALAAALALTYAYAVQPTYALDIGLGPLSVSTLSPESPLSTSASLSIGETTATVSASAQTGVDAGLSTPVTSVSLAAAPGSAGAAVQAGDTNLDLGLGAAPPVGGGDDLGFEMYGIRGLNGLDAGQVSLALTRAYSGLGAGDQQLLRGHCVAVLANPTAFDPGMVALCRLVARIGSMN